MFLINLDMSCVTKNTIIKLRIVYKQKHTNIHKLSDIVVKPLAASTKLYNREVTSNKLV